MNGAAVVARYAFLVVGLGLILVGLFGAFAGPFLIPGGGGGPTSGNLVGYVTVCQTGQPIVGASVTATASTTFAATTGSNGYYSVLVALGYTYTIQASAAGYVSASVIKDVLNSGTTVSFQLRSSSYTGACYQGAPPASSVHVDFAYLQNGFAVSFSANASGGNGGAYVFSWSFGDGSTGSGAATTHTYAAAGTYSVTVTAQDSSGAAYAGMATHVLTITNATCGSSCQAPTAPAPPNSHGSSVTTTPSVLDVALVVVGSVLVVIAAAWKD